MLSHKWIKSIKLIIYEEINLEISNVYIDNMSSKMMKSKMDSDDEDEVRSIEEVETDANNKKNTKKNDDDVSDEESDIGSDVEDVDEDEDADADGSDIDSAVDPDEIPTTSVREMGNKPNGVSMNYNFELDADKGSEEDDEDENYLQKFDENLKTNVIAEHHPELLVHNNDEVDILTRIVRNEEGVIVDPLHKTLPFLTKYEKARILGERAKQLNSGAKPFVEVEPSVVDGYLIALEEFKQKKIPFIVKRPLPHGGCEYWKLRDLEIL
jgi:DNA-directed RNA polymerase I, II, and III subunit RPABC2